jgi:hypothetical protein
LVRTEEGIEKIGRNIGNFEKVKFGFMEVKIHVFENVNVSTSLSLPSSGGTKFGKMLKK